MLREDEPDKEDEEVVTIEAVKDNVDESLVLGDGVNWGNAHCKSRAAKSNLGRNHM